MSPLTIKLVDEVAIIVAIALVPAVLLNPLLFDMVVPEPEMVTCPEPSCNIIQLNPWNNEGTVSVIGELLLKLIILPLSAVVNV